MTPGPEISLSKLGQENGIQVSLSLQNSLEINDHLGITVTAKECPFPSICPQRLGT